MKINFTSGAVLAVVAIAAGYFLVKKIGGVAGEVITKDLNPVNRDNVANRAVGAVMGEQEAANFFDKTFAAVELANPFKEPSTYAMQQWGYKEGESTFEYNMRMLKDWWGF